MRIFNDKHDQETKKILEFSLRDEIETNGYGIANVEILILAGVLVKENNNNHNTSWVIIRNFNKKNNATLRRRTFTW